MCPEGCEERGGFAMIARIQYTVAGRRVSRRGAPAGAHGWIPRSSSLQHAEYTT